MCGGEAEAYARAEPVIAAYARSCRLMGPVGAGQLTKMVNQICIAGLLQGLAEGLAFAQKAGLDGEAVLDVISKGAAGSWQMENRGKTMLDDKFDFGFAVDWMRKDLGICLEEANANGAALPATALIDQFYKDVQAHGRRTLGHLQPDPAAAMSLPRLLARAEDRALDPLGRLRPPRRGGARRSRPPAPTGCRST